MIRGCALVVVALSATSACAGDGAHDGPAAQPAITPRWVRAAGDGASQVPRGLSVDPTGDVVVVGEYGGTLDLAGPLETPKGSSVSGFVARMSRDGSPRWSRRIGSTEDAAAFAVAVDRDGHAHVGGWFRGTLVVDGFSLVSAGDTDAFLVELDRAGVAVRASRFGDENSQAITSVAVDATGVVAAGDFDGRVDLGGGALTSAGQLDAFVARFEGGAHAWSTRLGGPLRDQRPGVSLGRDGSVFVTGTYRGPVDLGGGPLPDRFDSAFLARLSPGGAHLWSKGFPGEGWCFPTAIGAESDRVALAMRFTDVVDLGRGPIRSESGEDALLAVFGEDGALRVAQRFGGFGQDVIGGLAWDRGALWVTGELQTSLGPLTSAGGPDLFVARLNAELQLLASARFGDAQEQRGTRVAVAPDGGAVVVGSFFGTLDLGVGKVSSAGGLDREHGDVFVASFAP